MLGTKSNQLNGSKNIGIIYCDLIQNPKFGNLFSSQNLTILALEEVFKGMASTHLVK